MSNLNLADIDISPAGSWVTIQPSPVPYSTPCSIQNIGEGTVYVSSFYTNTEEKWPRSYVGDGWRLAPGESVEVPPNDNGNAVVLACYTKYGKCPSKITVMWSA